ncbi:SHOCT domain-containing protein [Microbacterium aurum]
MEAVPIAGSVFPNFWEFLWSLFWIFVFVAYLFALFTIIVDLVTDRALKGWAKAIWLIFLVFVPLLTALIYLIARGGGIAQRQLERAEANKDATDAYIRQVAGAQPATEIAQAKQLLDAGTITAEEFDTIKRSVLGPAPSKP